MIEIRGKKFLLVMIYSPIGLLELLESLYVYSKTCAIFQIKGTVFSLNIEPDSFIIILFISK